MNAPTPDEIRYWSSVDFDILGFGEVERMRVLIERATEDVMNITGRTLESMPPELLRTAQLAIQLRVEQLAFQSQPDYVETLADFDLISSFSAGQYSETRRSVGEAVQAKVLSSNPALNGVLMGLLTPEKHDDYMLLLTGEPRPYIGFVEIDPSGGDLTL